MASTNILLTTFSGLSSQPTQCFSLPSDTTSSDLLSHIQSRLPQSLRDQRLILTTTSNHQIIPSNTDTISTLAPSNTPLPLRLSVPLCGGKGGFGSQLRAAGGRMASRKKKDNREPHGSSRNLDGRRLRTITEAKNLATYLATKPEMERKEKEERRKRWESVVEAAERREEEIRSGKKGKGLSEEWIQEKEDVGESVKDAVKRAMMGKSVEGGEKETQARGKEVDSASGDESEQEGEAEDVMELDDKDLQRLKDEAATGDVDAIWVLKNQVVSETEVTKKPPERRFVGFDEDDEFLSSDDETVDEPSNQKKANHVVDGLIKIYV